MSDVDDKFEPAHASEFTDEKLVAGQLQALQREVRSGFELISTKLLTIMDRVEKKLDDIDYRLRQQERAMSDEVRERKKLAERVEALELPRLKPRKKK